MNDDASLARGRGVDKNQNSSLPIRLRSRAIPSQTPGADGYTCWANALRVSQCLIARVWRIAKRMPPLDYERVACMDTVEMERNFSDFAMNARSRTHDCIRALPLQQQRAGGPALFAPRRSAVPSLSLPSPPAPLIRGGGI